MNNERRSTNKVGLIGTGMVGASFAYALMQHGVANELVLIDHDMARAEGEMMDLNHGMPFVRPMKITVKAQDRTGNRVKHEFEGMLARAMLHDPPVLLLDEPTSAMDPESARLVRDSIQELRSASRTIIICTHNLAEAEELADQIAIIRQGKIIVSGSPSDLKRDLLGPSEFSVEFGESLDGKPLFLPADAELTVRLEKSLHFRTRYPQDTNPLVLRYLLAQDLPVVGLKEVPRSLEQVYLTAINSQKIGSNPENPDSIEESDRVI